MNISRKDLSAGFNPFTDRRSRDIRNSLSEALVQALAEADPAAYHRCAREWLSLDMSPAFEAYIRSRLKRYDQVMASTDNRLSSRPYAGFVDIWNRRLFFEAHEFLETIWQRSRGDEHQALKGLIKAAGVYVHLENDNLAAARRLAPKALRQMKEFSHCLGFIANLEVLLSCMQRVDPKPPRLEFDDTFNPT